MNGGRGAGAGLWGSAGGGEGWAAAAVDWCRQLEQTNDAVGYKEVHLTPVADHRSVTKALHLPDNRMAELCV